jgi:hypothetical protein
MEIEIRLNIEEYVGTDEDHNEITTDDFVLAPEEKVELLQAIDKTLKVTAFFVGTMPSSRTFVIDAIPVLRAKNA